MGFPKILQGDAGNQLEQVRRRSVQTTKVRLRTHCAVLRECVLLKKLRKTKTNYC